MSQHEGRVPGLDGLRGTAILFVLLGHTQLAHLHAAGMVGVTVFFTLSGFLITALLLEEHERHGHIRLGRFYVRRMRRLAPALLVFLAVTGSMSLLDQSSVLPSGRDLLGAIFYVGNYSSAVVGRESIIMHTWSLCVEEQFYLVWPLVMVFFARRGRVSGLAKYLLPLIVMCVAARLFVWDGGQGYLRVNYATEMRADALLVGCLTAIHLRSSDLARRVRHWTLPAMAALCGAAVAWGASSYLLALAVVPWLTALMILAVIGGGGAWLKPRWLTLVGRRSYAIYLWHFPIFLLAGTFQGRAAVMAWTVALLLTAVIVQLSWRCVEEPVLRNDWFAARRSRQTEQESVKADTGSGDAVGQSA